MTGAERRMRTITDQLSETRYELKDGNILWLVLNLKVDQDPYTVCVVEDKVRSVINEFGFFYAERGGVFAIGQDAFEWEQDALRTAMHAQSLRVEAMVENLGNHKLNYLELKARLEEIT